ncbi:MAG: translation initiation factor [Planctomycetaceae bacterium]|nr:translation initiation factor [Planctomycetaceae bacterium]
MRLLEGTPFDRPPRCERCDRLESECECPPPEPQRRPPQKQTLRIGLEVRKGKRKVTVVRDLSPEDNDLPALLTQLKNRCGAGGTLKDGLLEIQGAQLDSVRDELLKIGFKVKG